MTTTSYVIIDGTRIGPGEPPYVIAEMSGNHGGKLETALALIDAASAAGASAVKLQTYTADSLTIDHDGPGFRLDEGLWAGRTLYDLYQEAHTPWDWHAALFARARERGITVFSSPFDDAAVALLEELDCPAYKIASAEIVDLVLISAVARTGKPVLISTGMAGISDIEAAVKAARAAGAQQVVLLHCVSGYPTPAADAHLGTMAHLEAAFGVPVGFSDHTLGIGVSVAAAALGAAVIEKHFCLDRADGAVDSAFSLEPAELAQLVRGVADAAAASGGPVYGAAPSETPMLGLRRSLYVVRDMVAGEAFTPETVRSIRPSGGLPPVELPAVLRGVAARPLRRGTPLRREDIRYDTTPEA